MSQWTDILNGLCDHVTLLQELGHKTVALDSEIFQALVLHPAKRSSHATPRAPTTASTTTPHTTVISHSMTPRAVNVPMVFSPDSPARSPDARRTALEELSARMTVCDACPLCKERNHCVPGQGNFNTPDVMFIGEAPGADEDREGVAFIGKAGQLLTRMIAAMGYTREEVFIANICKCRPPKNRVPTPEECAVCLPFLRAQISIIRPKTIVLLGGTAIKALLDTQSGVNRIQGQWTRYESIPVMPTFHPAYLLRFEPAKRDAWQALKRVLAYLGKPIPNQVPPQKTTPQT